MQEKGLRILGVIAILVAVTFIAGFPFNIPAISLYTKIGFQEVGIYKEQGILDGKWVDVILMEKILS